GAEGRPYGQTTAGTGGKDQDEVRRKDIADDYARQRMAGPACRSHIRAIRLFKKSRKSVTFCVDSGT
ncbi:MAG: hypothetical protein ACYSWQ_14315, partial [Planctomycetota bacterium]